MAPERETHRPGQGETHLPLHFTRVPHILHHSSLRYAPPPASLAKAGHAAGEPGPSAHAPLPRALRAIYCAHYAPSSSNHDHPLGPIRALLSGHCPASIFGPCFFSFLSMQDYGFHPLFQGSLPHIFERAPIPHVLSLCDKCSNHVRISQQVAGGSIEHCHTHQSKPRICFLLFHPKPFCTRVTRVG